MTQSENLSAAPVAGEAPVRRLPGEVGVWVFICGDMLVFALLFFVYLYYRAESLDSFQYSQQALSTVVGLLNTLVLLASSWFVARFMGAFRQGELLVARRFLLCAVAAALTFVGVKFFEYSSKIATGHTLLSGDFFMYYYMMTGIHLLHVLVGLAGLLYLLTVVGKRETSHMLVECAAVYWHMVDLLWIFLFPLLYLI